jgi:methionyl-tRNA synthetase
MELSEKERLMLVKKQEKILKVTKEIFDCMKDTTQALEIKKKMTSILSLISTIASYSESKNYNLDVLEKMTTTIFLQMDLFGEHWTSLSPWIEVFCNTVNNIKFNFTKRDIRIKMPKIDFSIFGFH